MDGTDQGSGLHGPQAQAPGPEGRRQAEVEKAYEGYVCPCTTRWGAEPASAESHLEQGRQGGASVDLAGGLLHYHGRLSRQSAKRQGRGPLRGIQFIRRASGATFPLRVD